jgi:hypothetical protein
MILCSVLLATMAACGGGSSRTGGSATPTSLSGAAPNGSAGSGSASATAQSSGGAAAAGGAGSTGATSISGNPSVPPGTPWGAVVLSASNVPPPTTSPVTIAGDTLSFSSFGVWTDTSTNPDGVSGVFASGTKTSSNAMPRSGSASYAGSANGLAVNAGARGIPLAGAFNASVDFGNAMVTGGMTMSQVGANGALTPYDSYSFKAGFALIDNVSGTAPIFIGAVTAANNKALTGNAQGTFFGPQAQEIGGTFALQGGGTTVVGAFGGTATTPLPGAPAGIFTGGAGFGASTVAVNMSNVTSGSIGLTPTASVASSTSAFAPSSPAFTSVASGTTTPAGAASGAFFGANAAQTGGVLVPGSASTAVAAFGGAKH